jgi:hypothetical protein
MKALLSLLAGVGLYVWTGTTQFVNAQKITEKQQIEARIIKNYGLDTLDLKIKIVPKKEAVGLPFGSYYSWNNYFNLNHYKIVEFAKINSLNADSLEKRVVGHELGHYKVDKLREKLGLRSEIDDEYSRKLIDKYVEFLKLNEWNKPVASFTYGNFVNDNSEKLTKIMCDVMIREGMAMYLEDPYVEIIQSSWPTSIVAINGVEQYNRFVYCTSLNLVQPIISVYGEKGIEFILKNMPTVDEFGDLQEYQKKVLEELAK